MRVVRILSVFFAGVCAVSASTGQKVSFDPKTIAAPKAPDAISSMKLMDRLQFAPPFEKFNAEVSARGAKTVLVLVQPNGTGSTMFEYQVSLVPLDNLVRADKQPGLVFASGILLNGKQSVDLGSCWPKLPDPSAQNSSLAPTFFVKQQRREGLKSVMKRNLRPAKVDPSEVMNQQIFETGSATVYIRYLAINGKGQVTNRSNSIRLRVSESAPVTNITSFSMVRRGGGGEFTYEEFPTEQHFVEAPDTLRVRYYTTDSKVSKVGVQVSKTPFPTQNGRWISPSFNRRWYSLPLKVSPPKSSANSAYLEQNLDLKGLLMKSSAKEQALYLRVVTLDAVGGLWAAPSAPIVVRVGKSTVPPIVVTGADGKSPLQSTPPTPRMDVNWSVTYVPPKPRALDFEKHMVTSRDCTPFETSILWSYLNPGKSIPGNYVIPAGTKVYFANPGNAEKSWVDAIIEAIKTAIDVLKMIVDYVSEQYAKLQIALVSAVADATGLPPSLVNFALQCAMSAIGLPPQIPNFDQLVDQGLDYMVTQAVQAAGLPESDFIKDTMKDGLKEMGKMMKDPPPGAPLYIPDRDFDAQPGFLKFTVKAKWNGYGSNMSPIPSKAHSIDIIASGLFQPDPSNLGTLFPTTEKIFYKNLPIPSMKDGESLSFTIPVSLTDEYWLNRAAASSVLVDWQVGYKSTKRKISEAWSL